MWSEEVEGKEIVDRHLFCFDYNYMDIPPSFYGEMILLA